MKSTKHNGFNIYENDVVQKNGRLPIVCIHGMWCFALIFRFWFQIAEQLGIKMYAIELRGHDGHSDCSGISLKTYIDDVSNALRTQIGDCVLLGHSMGGLIAQNVAARNSCVKKLVLVTSASPAGILLRGKIITMFLKLKYVLALVRGQAFKIDAQDALKLIFNVGFSRQEALEFINSLNPESGRAALDQTLGQYIFWGRNRIKIEQPILAIGAEEDEITPMSLQHAIARRYKQVTEVMISGASHMVMLQPVVRVTTFNTIIDWAYDGKVSTTGVS